MDTLTLKFIKPLRKGPGGTFVCNAKVFEAIGRELDEVTIHLSRADYQDIVRAATAAKTTAWDVSWVRTIDRATTSWAIAPVNL